jgi:hypothetical protein
MTLPGSITSGAVHTIHYRLILVPTVTTSDIILLYYFYSFSCPISTTTGLSYWRDPLLPAGWGYEQDGMDRVYVR